MVYNGNPEIPIKMNDSGGTGTTISGNLHVVIVKVAIQDWEETESYKKQVGIIRFTTGFQSHRNIR